MSIDRLNFFKCLKNRHRNVTLFSFSQPFLVALMQFYFEYFVTCLLYIIVLEKFIIFILIMNINDTVELNRNLKAKLRYEKIINL